MQLGDAITWFEVPVADFNRAKKFYETIFSYEMPESQMGPVHMGSFCMISKPESSGAIVHRPVSTVASGHWYTIVPDATVV